MNIKQLEQHFINEITVLYNEEEAKSLFYGITMHFEGWNRGYILLNREKEVGQDVIKNFNKVLNELKAGKPLQYILTETFFYGLKFKVNPDVLIPRPETEELVDWILETIKVSNIKIKTILDVGTGSGCIAITLKKQLKEMQVTAMDISVEALTVARENANFNETDINFINDDILHPIILNNYDLIVSNPPYVREVESLEMHYNVLDHEPHLALFVSNEKPLIYYEAIADFALQHLNKNGIMFFEINEYLGKETIGMLDSKGFKSILLKKDMQGKDRMVRCQL